MFTFDQSLQDCPFPSLYQPEVILIIILIHATYLIVLDLTPLILFCEEYNNTALSPSLLSSQANKSMFLKHNMGFKMRLSSQDESCIHILRTDTTEKQCSCFHRVIYKHTMWMRFTTITIGNNLGVLYIWHSSNFVRFERSYEMTGKT